MSASWCRSFVTGVVSVFLAGSFAHAIDANRVLVLYNVDSSDGYKIATHYAQRHPGARILGIENLTPGEEITSDEYLSIVRPQVLEGIQTRTDVLVTTKGMPLRIYNNHAPASYPYNYTDPDGVPRTIFSDTYKRYSSLESELTRVDKFKTWKQMGDQTWWYPPPGSHPAVNPYFKRDQAFSASDPAFAGMRLTARLDGYSFFDVRNMIDRATRAYTLFSGQTFVVDNTPNSSVVTAMPQLANNVLIPRGQTTIYNTSTTPTTQAPGQVMGYVGFGTNDASGLFGPNYIRDQLNFTLANGAILDTWESYNAYSFIEGNNHLGQGLIADWIRKGGTAAIGNVEEPGGNLNNVVNEDRLFEMMLNGYTFAEAAWNAMPQLSYTNTVLGDPLMTWRPWVIGDATFTGLVDHDDYDVLSEHWLRAGTVRDGDFNGDNFVDMQDYNLLRDNWLASDSGDPANPGAAPPPPVPEPSGMLLLGAAAMLLSRRVARA
ncbi:MAG: TIGR03790 family protein [Tepidisphaeraceae bacterium]